ncbi:DUF6197 family protein [Streptomyces sp. NPDC001774]
MTTSDDLLAAAEYLTEHGWHQGQMYDHPLLPGPEETPAACALGAISTVTECQWARAFESRYRLGQYLHANGLLPYTDAQIAEHQLEPAALIPNWNDHPSRTKEDVILALKRAAGDG